MERLKLLHEITIIFPQAPPPGEKVTASIPIRDILMATIDNRGQILSTTILIEQKLEQILEILLHQESYNASEFGKKMWRKRNIDFNVKFQMLRALSSSHTYIQRDKDDWKLFRQVLSEVIEIRNCFAHGKIYFKEDKIYLEFIKAEKEKSEELNDTYWKTIQETFDQATKLSANLMGKLLEYSNVTSNNSK